LHHSIEEYLLIVAINNVSFGLVVIFLQSTEIFEDSPKQRKEKPLTTQSLLTVDDGDIRCKELYDNSHIRE